MGGIFSSLLSVFYDKKLDMVICGLSGSGKTTFANILSYGQPMETVPTLGMNAKSVKHKGINISLWDCGGQQQYRQQWVSYTTHTDLIVFVVDSQQPLDIYLCKKELNIILEQLNTFTPILVLVNKVDLGSKLTETEVIEGLNLDYITEHPWVVIPCSAKDGTNIDKAINFLTKHAK